MKLSKAELARKLKVSPAYITMLCSGQRNLSKKLQRKVNKLGLTNELMNMTLNQQVTGSIPVRLTSRKSILLNNLLNFFHCPALLFGFLFLL